MKETNMMYRRAFWVVSCIGVLLSTTSLARAHTRWLVLDSIQAEGDADVTEVSDIITDVRPDETLELEDEFWSEALQNVEVSSALDTDDDIPTLTAEGSFILPTYILPETDVRKNVETIAVVDENNPWRQEGAAVTETAVVETASEEPSFSQVEEEYAETEDLLAQTSTRLETIEERIRALQEMNAQMAKATQEAVDAETERLAATLPVAPTPVEPEPVAETPVEVAEVETPIPVVEATPVAEPTPVVETTPVVEVAEVETPAPAVEATPVEIPTPVAVVPPVKVATPVATPVVAEQPTRVSVANRVEETAVEVKTEQQKLVEAQKAVVDAQKAQIDDTKRKIAELQQTVEYAGLQVAYQDTTALLNSTAKKLKGLENDLTQLKKSEANSQKAKLVEDQYQKTAELLSVTTAQLESVEKRMAALDAQEAQLQAEIQAAQEAQAKAQAAQATDKAKIIEVAQAVQAEIETPVTTVGTVAVEPQKTTFDPYARRARAVEQQKQILAESQPQPIPQPQIEMQPQLQSQLVMQLQPQTTPEETALPTMKVADSTAIQLQNAADALANATARLEALEARLAATSHETNLTVATPSAKKRPWLLPVEAIEEETAETQEEDTSAANAPAVKEAYVDRVLQAIDRFEKNRTTESYDDDLMLRTIPNEIKINFQPGRAELSAQAMKWVRVFSASVRNRAQNAIEIRLGMQQLELQARRFALLKAALLSNGVSPRQIRFTLTNRDNDSVVLRVIPMVQDVDVQQRDTQTGQKVKQVIYQW